MVGLFQNEFTSIFYFSGLIFLIILIFGISIIFLIHPEIKYFSFLGLKFKKFKKKDPQE
jgi:hypothetical protein